MISLNLYDPLLVGNGPVGNYTVPFGATWRRSIARLGGFKIGSVALTANELTADEMGEFFRYGLLRELREVAGGQLTWQGLVTHMEWTHGGDVYIADIEPLVNARRALYRRLYDNLLTNGSAESGAWAAYNGATVTQSTEWIADGSYSCKVVVADAVQRGAIIQSNIAILSGIAYTFSARLHVLSGTWTIAIRRSDNDSLLVNFKTSGAVGDVVANLTIPATNTYEGNVYILIRTSSGSTAGTCYFDAAIFKAADTPSDTGWQTDTQSLAIHGRKEWIDLWGGMSYEAATARVASDLALSAWPQPDVSASGSTRQIAVDPKEDKLSIVFGGYWITLNWIYTRLIGSAPASTLVTTLAGYQSEYIVPGSVASNTLNYTIEDSSPLRCGDVLKEIAESGDAAGNRWAIGVYADRKLHYGMITPELSYHLRGGHLLQVAGGDMEPWLAQPGWARVDDLPIGPGSIGQAQNDPRWRYLEEIEMMPPDNAHPDYWLTYSREQT